MARAHTAWLLSRDYSVSFPSTPHYPFHRHHCRLQQRSYKVGRAHCHVVAEAVTSGRDIPLSEKSIRIILWKKYLPQPRTCLFLITADSRQQDRKVQYIKDLKRDTSFSQLPSRQHDHGASKPLNRCKKSWDACTTVITEDSRQTT